jgi:predicted Zn-dependent protease
MQISFGLTLIAALGLSGIPSASAQHHAPATTQAKAAATDPVLEAMKAELAREQQLLVLPGMQRPYFIQYRLEDFHSYEAVANYGALTRETETHQRVVHVEVRVGDYATDSSTTRGEGSLALAPTDNDVDAIRFALWTATDAAYKAALRAYAAKQAALKQYQTPPTADDFSPAKPVTHIEPLLTMELTRDEWKRRITQASGLYATAPEVSSFAADVQYSSANISALVLNRYMVNTDGAALRQGYASYQDIIDVGGQAPDGMQLSRDNGSTATTAAGLESWASLRQRTLDDLKSYDDLRHAPVVNAEEYHGPVLFDGDAAADVFNRLFVPNIEANRPDMGTTARTRGVYQTSYQSLVLPYFLSVVDDPTMRSFDGEALLGAYAVDDEGVPAQAVKVVDHGDLANYLTDREPVKDFPASNGHGRAIVGQSARPRAGVLIVKSTEPFTAAQMQAKLLALAKEQNRDVYETETLIGGRLAPRVLYRISPDGKRTLVRGATFDELDQRALRADIVAIGGKPWIDQTAAPLPETTIVPEVLFDDITVKRASQEQQKLPYYPAPETHTPQ